MGNDTILEVIGKRNIKATMQVGGRVSLTIITQVFHVPKMKNSFICPNPTLRECEDDTHTPEMGTWKSLGNPENSVVNYRGQNTSP
jgi:hypothetical protein